MLGMRPSGAEIKLMSHHIGGICSSGTSLPYLSPTLLPLFFTSLPRRSLLELSPDVFFVITTCLVTARGTLNRIKSGWGLLNGDRRQQI